MRPPGASACVQIKMQRKTEKALLKLLKEEMKPAIGCTELVAVALVSAKASQAVGGELKEIRITTDPTLYKMGVSVVIPGTNETGFPMAALLGAIVGDAEIGLEVLKHVNEESVTKAKALLDKGIVKTSIKGDETRIYVEASVKTSKGYGRAVIRDMHDNVVLVEFNNKVIYQKDEIDRQGEKFNIRSLAVNDLIQFAKNIPFEDIEFVLDAVTMNKELAQDGLTGRYCAWTAVIPMLRFNPDSHIWVTKLTRAPSICIQKSMKVGK